MMDEHEQSINEQQELSANEQQELSAEQAAVHLPSEASNAPLEAPDTPMEASAAQTNGIVSQPAAPPPSPEHPELFEQTAPFWQVPLPPRTYMDPPFYPNPFAPRTEQEVLTFQQYLRQAGYELEAIDLEHKFEALVQSAGYEYERVRHELEPVRLRLQEEIRQCEAELEQKKNEFVQQMARARLTLPQPDKKSRGNPSALIITPQLVENALTHDFATHDEICGQHGVTPTSEKEGGWAVFNRIGQWLLDLFAPLFAGLILGINIAAITGFLRLEDFRQGRTMWLVALAAFIGFFIEKLVGTVYYHLTSSLAQASEQPFNVDEARPFPRLRTTIPLLTFSLFALLLGAAVVVVDALGLRMLHEQAVQQAKLLGTETGEVLSFWVYLIAGCVISLPYLIYKAMMGWRQGELRLRDARIAYLRWKHIEERRSEPEVQAAFRLAQEVVSLQEQLASLKEQLEGVKARLDSARTQAVGCHREFIQYWEALRDRLIAQRDGVPTGRRGRDIPFNRRAMGEQPDTLLRRLMRAFGRG